MSKQDLTALLLMLGMVFCWGFLFWHSLDFARQLKLRRDRNVISLASRRERKERGKNGSGKTQ